MNKSTLNIIERALQLKSHQVRHNKTWQSLYDEYQIGTKVADGFLLSDKDFEYLQNLYQKYAKTNSDDIKNTDNRLTTATHFVNEKWAKNGVFDEYLLFACLKSPLPTKTGERMGGNGCLLLVNYDEIVVSAIEKLIIIENGTLMTHCERWHYLLPEEWQSAIILYRGHRANTKYVKALIERLDDKAMIAIYADLDLSGLDIVADYAKIKPNHQQMHIILPKHWQTFDNVHRDNQPLLFAKQNIYQRHYSSMILTNIYEHLMNNKLAITQENVLNLGELAVYKI